LLKKNVKIAYIIIKSSENSPISNNTMSFAEKSTAP